MMSKIVPLLCALLLAAPSVHAGTDDTCVHALPANLDAPENLRQYLGLMLQRSATFRQQCQRLDVNGVLVHIRLDPQLVDRPYRARSTIGRLPSGGLRAWVTITPFGDPTQWLAHEIEHIIEQLEGVHLRQLALAPGRDAWRTGNDMFETERAVRVGRLVVQEMHAANRALAHAGRAMETGGRGD